MRRSSLVLVLWFLLTLGHSALGAEAWLPLAEGNRWDYRVTETTGVAGLGVKRTSAATCVARQGKEGAYLLEWSGEDTIRVKVRAKGAQVEVLESSSHESRILPGDLSTPSQAAGKTFRLRVNGSEIDLYQHQVSKPSEIKVPYGKVLATSVSSEIKVASVKIRSEVWFAQGLGVVRVVEEVISAGAVGVKRILELVSFKAGGAAPQPASPQASPRSAPATPTSPKEGPDRGAGLVSLRTLVASWVPREWKELRRGVEGVVSELEAAKVELPFPRKAIDRMLSKAAEHPLQQVGGRARLTEKGWFEDRRILSKGLTAAGGLKDVLVVSRGPVAADRIKNSLVFVDGDVSVKGYVKDVILVVHGKVEIKGYLKDSLVLCTGSLVVGGYVKDLTCEAKSAKVAGHSKGSTWIGTKLSVGRQEGDRVLELKGRLVDRVLGGSK